VRALGGRERGAAFAQRLSRNDEVDQMPAGLMSIFVIARKALREGRTA
jgi:hypothetical protein